MFDIHPRAGAKSVADTALTTPRLRGLSKSLAALGAVSLMALATQPVHADSPGRGQTAQFEKDYLAFIIDHHYAALRMTELAAGTDPQRDAAVSKNDEGTSPTPDTQSTPPKAGMAEIKSMARANNRMQREEIQKAQKFLRDWYGMTHTPTVRPENQQQIQLLEQTAAGAEFERTFLQTFSNHHYAALHPSLDCQVKSDIDHHQLQNYCEGIVHTQVRDINDMRDMLCKQFSICDFQPGVTTSAQASSSFARRP